MIGTLAFWKTAHILSAAVVFGTGLGIAFFCWFGYRHAMRDGDISVLRSTLRLTVVADAWLTANNKHVTAVKPSRVMAGLSKADPSRLRRSG